MRIQIPAGLTGLAVARRLLFLAYEASRVVGRGRLQARPDQTEEDVWKQNERGDGGIKFRPDPAGEVHADYVFGRMLKLSFKYGDDFIDIGDQAPHPEYQSWVQQYPTYQALAQAAIDALLQPA